MISVIVSAATSGSFEIITDLQEQTHQDFEVLVAGPSGPFSLSIAGQGIEVLQDPIPQASKALALNAVLGRARGEYILTIESDDRMHPGALELLSAAAERAGDHTAMIIPGFEVMGSIGPAGRPGWTYTPSETADKLDMILRATPGPLFLRSERVRNAGGWPADYPSEGNLYPNLALLMKLLVAHGSTSLPETVFRLRREKVTSSAEALAWWPIYKFLVARAAKAIGRLSQVCFDNQYERATMADSVSCEGLPLVTVAMAVYNAEPYVRLALESALNQTYPNTEVIVVDDGSSDRTATIVRSYETDRVRLIELTRNSGKGACMNVALDHARGDYLFELDGDDWLDPDATEVYVEAMLKASSDVVCVHGRRRAFASAGPGDLHFETVFPGRPIKD
ncbi:MAG: glycosyltransferase family 2 protein [Actinobacteria bacterium]|nr:glycosyltransferase family 2 protein [Actinomycetota bacterium]